MRENPKPAPRYLVRGKYKGGKDITLEDFKEAMKDTEAGRIVDMEKALFETPPPHLR